MRIRILVIVMQICDHFSTTLHGSFLSLHATIASLHDPPGPFVRLYIQILNFDFVADPKPAFDFDAYSDPGFHSKTDPDPASQSYANPDPRS